MKTRMIDSHVHIGVRDALPIIEQYRKKHGFDYLNMVCLECYQEGVEYRAGNNLLGIVLKLDNPHYYVHANLLYPEQPVSQIPADWELGEQAKLYREIGFDGMKIIESKPILQKSLGIFLDDPAYDSYFDFLEESGMHIVWHTGDPETFWDKNAAPEFCFRNGWFYGDGTFADKDRLYQAVYHVLEKHPKLNATFAHFMFYSHFPEKVKELLERYPNVCLDITPGSEMYEAFTQNYSYWRDFFECYSDRIIFGTDVSYGDSVEQFERDSDELVETMRRFLTTDDTFEKWGYSLKGFKLSKASLDNILGNNFARRVSPEPAPINRKALAGYVDKALAFVNNPELRKWYEKFFEERL